LALYIWACGVLYTFNVKWQHVPDGVVQPKPTKSKKSDMERMAMGLAIWRDGKVQSMGGSIWCMWEYLVMRLGPVHA
jgi:hypothetical protein